MPRQTDSQTPWTASREHDVVVALRRIIRAVDLHSRRLLEDHGLTGPQLATLREVERDGPLSPAAISERVHLSRATVTGILTRLARRGLIERARSPADGRSVRISLTDLGHQVLSRAPSLLQDRFRSEFSRLAEAEQLQLLATLERIARMMRATELDAAPHLVTRAEDLGGPAPDAAPPTEHDPLQTEPLSTSEAP